MSEMSREQLCFVPFSLLFKRVREREEEGESVIYFNQKEGV